MLNPSDPNANVDFGFCEFTLNDAQLYANISYVDFVPRLPIAITLQQASGETQHVMGTAPDGLDRLAAGLCEQTNTDKRPWDKLIVKDPNGRNLRVLNATHGNAVGANFDGHYEPFVDQVWQKYSSEPCMKIDTQAGPGVLEGRVNPQGELVIGDEVFHKPSSADILGCNSGPFTTSPSATRNAIIPRLAAGFIRSTFLSTEQHPSDPSTFYKQDPTNHYARLVHEVNLDGKGYAFAYDDVQPEGGDDQSGKVNAGDPVLFTVTVGGKSAGGHQQQHVQQRVYQRPAPPPPQGEPAQQPLSSQEQHEGGLKGRMRGLKERFLH